MADVMPDSVFNTFFSCFSSHPVRFKDVLYPTAEHAYHVQRYTDPVIVGEIMEAKSGREVWEVAQKYKASQHPDFNEKKIEIMQEILKVKLMQHSDVRDALLASGNQLIIKNQPLDPFWGNGPDGTGRNELGKLWMKLRTELSDI